MKNELAIKIDNSISELMQKPPLSITDKITQPPLFQAV